MISIRFSLYFRYSTIPGCHGPRRAMPGCGDPPLSIFINCMVDSKDTSWTAVHDMTLSLSIKHLPCRQAVTDSFMKKRVKFERLPRNLIFATGAQSTATEVGNRNRR